MLRSLGSVRMIFYDLIYQKSGEIIQNRWDRCHGNSSEFLVLSSGWGKKDLGTEEKTRNEDGGLRAKDRTGDWGPGTGAEASYWQLQAAAGIGTG